MNASLRDDAVFCNAYSSTCETAKRLCRSLLSYTASVKLIYRDPPEQTIILLRKGRGEGREVFPYSRNPPPSIPQQVAKVYLPGNSLCQVVGRSCILIGRKSTTQHAPAQKIKSSGKRGRERGSERGSDVLLLLLYFVFACFLCDLSLSVFRLTFHVRP